MLKSLLVLGAIGLIGAGLTADYLTTQQAEVATAKKVSSIVKAYPVSTPKTTAEKEDDQKTKGMTTVYDAQLENQGKKPTEMTLGEKSSTYIKVSLTLDAQAAIEKISTPKADGTTDSIYAIDAAEKSVVAAQKPMQEASEKITGKKVADTSGYLVNTFSIEAKPSQLAELAEIAGVKGVSIQGVYQTADTDDNEIAQVTDEYRKVNGADGAGILIADIDSGIDYTHPDLKLTKTGKAALKLSKATTTAFVKANNYGVWESKKVPYAHNYAVGSDKKSELKDSTGVTNMHGQHVAGIMAANGKVQGVAPEAQLLDMKVFANDEHYGQGAFTDAIIDAIEDSVKLGADVMNLSLGGTMTTAKEIAPESIALNRAADAGVVPVVAASNDGRASTRGMDDNHTDEHNVEEDFSLGDLAYSDGAISVASMEGTSKRPSFVKISKDGVDQFGMMQVEAAPGIPDDIWDDVSTIELLNDSKDSASGQAGGTMNDISNLQIPKNEIIVVKYKEGTLEEIQKMLHAKSTSSHIKGLILIDNKDREMPSFGWEKYDESVAVPSIGMSYEAGQKLTKYIMEHNESVNNDNRRASGLSISEPFIEKVDNADSAKMSTFSSWGTTPDLEIKPDVTGIGGHVWSLTNDGYQQLSGTSMASPFVAGSVALLKQQAKKNNTDLGQGSGTFVKKIRTMLQNTASPVADVANNSLYSPRQQGAGMVQVDSASKATTVVTDASDGDGVVNLKSFATTTKTFKLNIQNTSNKRETYTIDGGEGVQTEVRVEDPETPNKVGIKAHGSSIIDMQHLNDVGLYYMADEKENLDLVNDELVADSEVTSNKQKVTIAANAIKTVQVTITLPDTFAEQNWVEGYVKVTPTSDLALPAESIPYVGFYGDWDQDAILDKSAEEKGSVYGYGYLANGTSGLPLRATATDVDDPALGGKYWTNDPNHAALSFSSTSSNNAMVDFEQVMRWSKELSFDVLDGQKKTLLKHLATYQDVAPQQITADWDGMLPDPTNGDMNKAPDGIYYIRVKATSWDGKKTEIKYHKLTVDNVVPKVKNVTLVAQPKESDNDEQQFVLSGEIEENGSGIVTTDINPEGAGVSVRINGKEAFYKAGQNSAISDVDWNAKKIKFTVNQNQLTDLKETGNTVEFTVRDNAGNGNWYENKILVDLTKDKGSDTDLTTYSKQLNVDTQGEEFALYSDVERTHLQVGAIRDPMISSDKSSDLINAFDLTPLGSDNWQITMNGDYDNSKAFTISTYTYEDQLVKSVQVTPSQTGHWKQKLEIATIGYITFTDETGEALHKPLVPNLNVDPMADHALTDSDEKIAQINHGKWVMRGETSVLVVPNDVEELTLNGQFNEHQASKMFVYNAQTIDQQSGLLQTVSPGYIYPSGPTDDIKLYHKNNLHVVNPIDGKSVGEASEIDSQGNYSATVHLYDAQELANSETLTNKTHTDSPEEVKTALFEGATGANKIEFNSYDKTVLNLLEQYNSDRTLLPCLGEEGDKIQNYATDLKNFVGDNSITVYRLPAGYTLDDVEIDDGKNSDPILPIKAERVGIMDGLTEANPVEFLTVDGIVDPSNLVDDNNEYAIYNPDTKEYTISGYALPTVANMKIIINSTDPNATENQVKINADGSFKYVAKDIENVTKKLFTVEYDYSVNDVVKHSEETHVLAVDLGKPVVHLDTEATWIHREGSNVYDVYTTNTKFTLSGTVTSHNGGSTVMVNDETVFNGIASSNDSIWLDEHGDAYMGLAAERFSKTYTLQKGSNSIYILKSFEQKGANSKGDAYEIHVHQVSK
jgi:subtilisin family serine protease